MSPDATHERTGSLSSSANVISRFLSLNQIYTAHELDTYLATLSAVGHDTFDQKQPTPDIIALSASAILAIAEAVFEWAAQYFKTQNDANSHRKHPGSVLLVLCGGIGPSTSFIYQAIKANAKYSGVCKDIKGKPEAEVLRTMAERFYGLQVNNPESKQVSPGNLSILVENQSVNYTTCASEVRKVLESHGVHNPRSITVVHDPNMSRRTVESFNDIYGKQRQGLGIASWPAFLPDHSHKTRQGLGSFDKPNSSQLGLEDGKRLWSMDRFLDRILGDIPRLGQYESVRDSGFTSGVEIPDEVEDAWSTVLDGYNSHPSLQSAPTITS
ncbi:hypothetical protein FZEAL_7267 [Fusarium zealandicum]|uniref:DUF218 domain-containing protein n=1 Tax=Fusarium zealandicum TaxID=1053134 RepID=A0A8H4UH10_9HYPO|nr:hypothetical protein FZEAL_7267 [Fusarium zealandicum]